MNLFAIQIPTVVDLLNCHFTSETFVLSTKLSAVLFRGLSVLSRIALQDSLTGQIYRIALPVCLTCAKISLGSTTTADDDGVRDVSSFF